MDTTPTTLTTAADSAAPAVHLISFGFLHGPVPEADLVLDVRRWLHDPAAAKAILDLDGRDARVQQTVYGTPGAVELVEHAVHAAGVAHRGERVLAFGCAGGRHRSVALAELAAGRLALRGYRVSLEHRDVHRPRVLRAATTTTEPDRREPRDLYFEAPNYYLPQPGDAPAVFLAGGITGCPRWHDHAAAVLAAAPEPVVVLNPNRADFPIHDPAAGWEQVSWEQHHLHLAETTTLFWFPACDPAVTVQPIAMYELGQALGEGRRIVVGADPGYPRVADVRMLCQLAQPGLPVHSTLDDTLAAVLDALPHPAEAALAAA
ncbi:nucleoside 2-deoxyribosyltransferase domain-containing protein [Amycolatopsis sp. cg9]|uniref:RapZ C-terminal domain-containing protein n=1 Tax=Amycolatopsis sp. cg9 TaxID=3238801 RepID=UPI003523875B